MSAPDGTGAEPRLGALIQAGAGAGIAPRERYAEAVIDARLGRHARDVLEATVVLEAWTGRPSGPPASSSPPMTPRSTA